MTTKSTGTFTVADVAEILEASGWEAGADQNGLVTRHDRSGNFARLTRMHSGQIIVDLELADEGGPYGTQATIAIPESAGALCIARMILAAADADED